MFDTFKTQVVISFFIHFLASVFHIDWPDAHLLLALCQQSINGFYIGLRRKPYNFSPRWEKSLIETPRLSPTGMYREEKMKMNTKPGKWHSGKPLIPTSRVDFTQALNKQKIPFPPNAPIRYRKRRFYAERKFSLRAPFNLFELKL